MADIVFPKIFSQLETSYKTILLGQNNDLTFNIYDFGCLLMKLAEILNYYGYPTTPLELNERLKNEGGFVNGGEYVHGTIARLFPGITEDRTVTPNELTDDQLQKIRGALDNRFPVVIELDYNPKTVARDSHFVTIINYDPKDENNFTIVDPLGGRIVSLHEYLAFFKPSARKTIEQFIVFSGPVPKKEEIPMAATQPMQPEIVPVQPTQPIGEATEILIGAKQNELNVKMASQYKEVVKYLELEKPPEDAMYEDVRRVIAGYKSRVTDLENKKLEAEKKAGKLEVLIETQKAQITRLGDDLLNKDKLHKVELDTLKNTQPNFDKLTSTYKGVVDDLNGKLDGALNELAKVKNEKSDEKVEEAHTQDVEKIEITYNKKTAGNIFSIFNSIKEFFTKLN